METRNHFIICDAIRSDIKVLAIVAIYGQRPNSRRNSIFVNLVCRNVFFDCPLNIKHCTTNSNLCRSIFDEGKLRAKTNGQRHSTSFSNFRPRQDFNNNTTTNKKKSLVQRLRSNHDGTTTYPVRLLLVFVLLLLIIMHQLRGSRFYVELHLGPHRPPMEGSPTRILHPSGGEVPGPQPQPTTSNCIPEAMHPIPL